MLKKLIFGFAILVILAWVFGNTQETTDNNQETSNNTPPSFFKIKSYLKTPAKDRIFIISIPRNSPKDDVLRYARSRPHTPGKLTASYFFDDNLPTPNISDANDIFAANDLLYSKQVTAWSYAAIWPRKGGLKIFDCKKSKNEFCK